MTGAFRRVDVVRVKSGERSDDRDRAATEEPLEVRLHNRSFAVIMRTPGADRELAEDCGITLIGFLRGQNFNIYAHPERVTTSTNG
jgi:formate dehydrogenase assembly factor FdhD